MQGIGYCMTALTKFRPLDKWNPAKVWVGSECQICFHCKETIKRGEWSKQNATTGQIFHDDEAEDLGAYEAV